MVSCTSLQLTISWDEAYRNEVEEFSRRPPERGFAHLSDEDGLILRQDRLRYDKRWMTDDSGELFSGTIASSISTGY